MNIARLSQELQDLASKQGGVITSKEIESIIPAKFPRTFYRLIKELEDGKILRKYIRGVYVTQSFDPYVLFQKINPKSYVSFGNILAEKQLVGTDSKYLVRGVRIGRTRTYDNLGFRLEYVGTQSSLFFGFEKTNGIWKANAEKAFLDCLYYYLRGMKYSFDIYSDVNIKNIDYKKMKTFLKKYKNSKFKTFFEKLYAGYRI